jgi:uncharacterized membrane protein
METKQNVYSVVYHSLLIGMTVSTILFAAGVTIECLQRAGLSVFDPDLLMKGGTIAMILTPVSRVAVSIFAFAVDRDFKFTGITTFVLATIATSVVLGLTGVEMRH